MRFFIRNRRRHLSESAHSNPVRKQSSCPIPRLQCTFNVGDGSSGHVVPARVHVPGNPTPAQLHELRGTTAAGTDTIPHWDTSYIPHLQEKLQVTETLLLFKWHVLCE